MGTAAQNTQLLNLLKSGKLLNPDYVDTTKYYQKCSSSYETFYAAMDSIGVSCDWDLHCRIAAANGIEDFVGTAAQNTALLNLLKQGKLLLPTEAETTKPDNTETEDVKGENTDKVSCYPKCSSDYETFYAAMDSIGVSCDWNLHCRIAEINGIKDFVGTAAQNTQLLNLLKQGKLIKPIMPANQFYDACGSGYTTFYAAMDSIGVSCSWNLHCEIAEVNGIKNFVGTAAQNTELLNLLKQGLLINPNGTAGNNSCYEKCSPSYETFYSAMDSIGAARDWDTHCAIAKANGIENFVGTAAQNTQLLNLLKAGRLVKPKMPAKQFYDQCSSSYSSLYAALNSVGISCDWNLHCRIASINGITNFSGTVAQNTELLNLLKQGLLINPNGTVGNNACYDKCASSYTTFYAALNSIGISCDWELHCDIAKVNGIKDFVGTATQNTQLLNLLKAGRLVIPSKAIEVEGDNGATEDTDEGIVEDTPVENDTSKKDIYYTACSSSFETFYAAMDSIGVSCDWELHCRIAEYNGIIGFTGTAAQNTELLNLLKQGKLINPEAEKLVYYQACSSGFETFYAALDSIGISCDWELHCEIAKANGIVDFSGTVAQNTYLLSLLKAGVLIDPTNSVIINYDRVGSVGGGYDSYAGGMAGDGKIYAHGLDLSSWQGSNLNFQNIKNAGYSYVILRAGTSYGKDSCFETYYQRAKAAGLDVGAYYYSYATSVSGARTDANNMIAWLGGKTFEYPIYFDYEDPSQDYLSQTTSKNICLTFMDTLADRGYLVGLYTGYYKSTQLLLSQICEKYEFWVAYYYDNTYTSLGTSFCKRYGMYQYTCTKYVNGAGPFDANVAYKDYPAIVKKYGFNGY